MVHEQYELPLTEANLLRELEELGHPNFKLRVGTIPLQLIAIRILGSPTTVQEIEGGPTVTVIDPRNLPVELDHSLGMAWEVVGC